MLEEKGSDFKGRGIFFFFFPNCQPASPIVQFSHSFGQASQPAFRSWTGEGGGGGEGERGGYNAQDWCECRNQIPEKGHDCLLGKERKQEVLNCSWGEVENSLFFFFSRNFKTLVSFPISVLTYLIIAQKKQKIKKKINQIFFFFLNFLTLIS